MTTIISGTNGVNNVAPNTVAVGDLAFTVPITAYYETTMSWTNGALIPITHNLGVIPKLVMFEVVALVAVGELAIGDTEEITCGPTFYGTAGQTYGASTKKKTATTLQVRIGTLGLVIMPANGGALGVTSAQVNLKIKVIG